MSAGALAKLEVREVEDAFNSRAKARGLHGLCSALFFRPGFGGSDLAVTYPAQAQAT